MITKRFFQRFFSINKEIDSILSELESLRHRECLLESIDPNGMELLQLRQYMMEAKVSIEERVTELKEMRPAIIALIEQLEIPQEREVLFYRYVAGLRWEEIADKMSYAPDTLFRWHKLALKHIKFTVS